MGHHRIDAIEARIERLRERTDDLHEEFAGVRSRVRALEDDVTGPVVDRSGAPDRDTRGSHPAGRTRPAEGAHPARRGRPAGGGGPGGTAGSGTQGGADRRSGSHRAPRASPGPVDGRDQASDAEVEAAVRRVETRDGSPSIEEPSADGPATDAAGDRGSADGDDDEEAADGTESQEIIVA